MGVAVLALVVASVLCLGQAHHFPAFGEQTGCRIPSSTDRSLLDSQGGRSKSSSKSPKKGRMVLSLLLGLKMLGFSVVVPLIVALALWSAWKGVTISLLAFMIASIVGLKSLITKGYDDHKSGQNVILAKLPGGGGVGDQWWRRLGVADIGGLGGAFNPYGAAAGLYAGAGLQPY